MKIAQVVCVYPPYNGGIGQVAKRYADLLMGRGHQVFVFTPKYKAEQKPHDNLFYLKPLFKLGNGAFIPQLFFKLNNFDVVHFHYPFFGGLEPIWANKFLHIGKFKLLIHFHMEVDHQSPLTKTLALPSRLIKNSFFALADKITCASTDYVEGTALNSFYQKNKKKFVELPFAVDTNFFHPAPKKEKKDCQILFVGGLDRAHYFKGLDLLLEVLAGVGNGWNLNIVGEGELKRKYEEKCACLKIVDKVKFFGALKIEHLIKEYQEASFLVLPSINANEAFGLVLIEAMACGTPVIASALRGVRKVFQNEKQGFYVQPKSKKDLREKLTQMMENPIRRREMGEKARRLAEEKYSNNKIGEKLESIYNNT